MAYNPATNTEFFKRLGSLSRTLQGVRDECQRLEDLWNAEAIGSLPQADFIAVEGVTTGEATNMITTCQEIRAFFENGGVTTGDRVPRLTPFLALSGRP